MKKLFIPTLLLILMLSYAIPAWAANPNTIMPLEEGEAATVDFFGAIIYQPSPRTATVTLLDSAGEPIYITTTALDGSYTLKAPAAPAGTKYILVVRKPGYLSYTIRNLKLSEGEPLQTIDICQLAGDVNGDGMVNSIDLTYLLSEFNRAPLNYPQADIDGNGLVNSVDLTYLLAGFNKRNVEVILEDDIFLPDQITINAVAGKEYDISVSASGIGSFSGKEIKVKYDAAVFEVVDLCAFTWKPVIEPGPIAAAGITVTYVGSGEIRLTVDKTVPAGKQWSGVVDAIRFRAKATRVSVVSVEY